MKIYVIRHGRTDCNDAGVFNGRTDEDINETGIMQAEKASKEVEKLDIDLVICSPLKRTRHTAEIVNVNNIPVIYDDRFVERDSGELTLKSIDDDDREEYWNYYSTRFEDLKNLETVPELFDRIRVALDDIKEKYKDKNILIVTHNGVARAIYAYFNEMPEDGMVRHFGKIGRAHV